MKRLSLALLIPLVACRSTGAPDAGSQRAPRAVGSVDAASGAAERPILAEPNGEAPLAWGTRPPATGPFFPVIDGECEYAGVRPVENAVFLSYLGAALVRLDRDGIVATDEVTRGLDTSLWIGEIGGSWPDRLYLHGTHGSDRSSDLTGEIWIRSEDGWKRALQGKLGGYHDFRSPLRIDDALVTLAVGGKGGKLSTVPLQPKAALPHLPSLMRPGFWAGRLLAWNGEFLAFGGYPKTTVRRSDHGAIREDALDGLDFEALVAAAPDFVVFATVRFEDKTDARRPFARRFDGKRWAKDPLEDALTPDESFVAVAASPTGDVWAVTSSGKLLVESKGGTVNERVTPELISRGVPNENNGLYSPEPRVFAGVEQGDPWFVGRSGAVYHLAHELWEKVELPAPPFAIGAKYAAVFLTHTADDIFVNADDSVKDASWRMPERYHAILSTKRPHEVLRCSERDVGGFRSWPPPAKDDCKKPFVVLARETPSLKLADVYPLVRAAMGGVPGIGGQLSAVEFESGGNHFLGARVPSVEAGRGLARELAKVASVRPEIVCAEPVATRTTHIEAVTE